MVKLKELWANNKKFRSAVYSAIAFGLSLIGMNEVSNKYTIVAKPPEVIVQAPEVHVAVTVPDQHVREKPHPHKNWNPSIQSTCEQMINGAINEHLDDRHGGS